MIPRVEALKTSLKEIPGCQVSSIISVVTGLTRFRAGEMPPELAEVEFDYVTRELARVFSANLKAPYGEVGRRPTEVDFLEMRIKETTSIFGVRITPDHFWATLIHGIVATEEITELIRHYALEVSLSYQKIVV